MIKSSLHKRVITIGIAASLSVLSSHAAQLDLYQTPLFLSSQVDPNVLINMSVETPMGGAAYNDQSGIPAGCGGRQSVSGDSDIGTCYQATTEYLGYFDANKCYVYSSNRFEPSSTVLTNHTCSGKWSGNFLNWATMTAIDMFIINMTGGNRVTDTTSLTVIRRARKQNNNSWFPIKVVGSSENVAPSTVTPYSDSRLYIYNTDFGVQLGTTYALATGSLPDKFSGNVDVKVCDTALGTALLESNCVSYGSYYKPEGLIQRNSLSKRFGVLSYTMDGSSSRDGGVLRSNMKYVGPTLPDGSSNPKKEYGTNGLLIDNPEGATSGLNSGVINYINKFSTPGYKSLDPISELFYEGIRYFKNEGPTPEYSAGITRSNTDAKSGGFWFANSASDWQDPMQYRCQKNFMVAINDANPWLDKRLPGTAFTASTFSGASGTVTLDGSDYGEPSNPDTAINVRTLTNQVGAMEGLNGTTWTNSGTWTSTGTISSVSGTNDSVGGGVGNFDNSCSNKTVANLGEVMGTCPYPPKQNSYYIAGLAYYANVTDLRSDFANDIINGKTRIQNLQSFIIDTQEYSSNPLDGNKNMLWLAGKYGGFTDTNGDGIPQAKEWDANGDGVPDNYVLATQPQALVSGLSAAFAFIDSQTATASSAAVNSGRVSSSSRVYQAQFDSGDWTGHLYAYGVNSDGTLQGSADGSLVNDELWDAAAQIPAFGSRNIITVGSETTFTPKFFTWTALSSDATRVTQLSGTSPGPQKVLDYIRGDDSEEVRKGGSYRDRISKLGVVSKLGDIVNSTPIYVGPPSASYSDTLEASAYSTFAVARKSRVKTLYVGANDGMLHAFNANTGVELFSFIPSPVFGNLVGLTNSVNFVHKYYVDGSPNVRDAYFGSNWHTVLVGGLNSGGQGIYALDVTAPASFSTSDVLWEFTDKNDADLGYTYSQPAIVRLNSGKWAAIFGNGYNSSSSSATDTVVGSGHAVLYVVDLQNGNLIKKFDTMVGTGGTPNGLATPAVIDANGDDKADYVYAGDLKGNLWKFDISNTDPASWSIPYTSSGNPAPLYTATDSAGNAQPITSRPEVGRGAQGLGFTIVFGTGKWIEVADKTIVTNRPQSFYGIYDPNSGTNTDAFSGRNLLGQQQISQELLVSSTMVREVTNNAVGARGWYLDLIPPSGTYAGERVISNPILRNGRVIFTTLTPSSDVCGFGGSSWVMELNMLTGARLSSKSPFDVNGDGVITSADLVTFADGTVPVGGIQTSVGIVPEPGVLTGDINEFKYLSGSSGAIQTVTESGSTNGRQSWREMR